MTEKIPEWYRALLSDTVTDVLSHLKADKVPETLGLEYPSNLTAAVYILAKKRADALPNLKPARVDELLDMWYAESYIHMSSVFQPVTLKASTLELRHLPKAYEPMGGLYLPDIGTLYVVRNVKGQQEVFVYEETL